MDNLMETVEYKEYGYKVVNCPICGEETLDNFWICERCGWEYDGTVGKEYSMANDSIVEEYRYKYENK